ncbi:MAG: type I-F CRISPR-associated protein Csy3 [Venatoribacter sp.]
MAKSNLKTASVLAFERKHANSDALMYAGNWQDRSNPNGWEPISVLEKAVRGTISNRLKPAIANDPLKVDAEIDKPNLQRVDTASLLPNTDTLKVSFTLRVHGDLVTPSVCNDQDYQEALTAKIQDYIEREQFAELAARYAENLANGRFLWRNRVGAEQIEVRVHHMVQGSAQQTWVFDALQFDMRQFGTQADLLKPLADLVQQGLLGDNFVLLNIEAFVRMGEGQEIFPSQELVLDSSGSKNGKKSKFLYHVNNVAAMHSQKIGNALRTIDTWYPEAATWGPIAIEPYGSMTNRGTAYRQPKEKQDFYNLLDKWILKDEAPTLENQHYVIGVLIRGGVFGEAG